MKSESACRGPRRLPVNRFGLIARAAIASLALVAAPAAAQTVIAIGPSSTAGAGVSPSQAYPAQLEAMLRAKGISATVVNAGINGEQTPQMLARLNGTVPDGTRVVILNLTRYNDLPISRAGARNPIPPDETERNFRAMVAAMKARRIPTVVLTREGGGRGAAFVPYNEVRGADILPDGIHPSPQGHARIAARLLPVVERLLKSGR